MNKQELRDVLAHYLSLEPCWDGYSASIASRQSVQDATLFVDLLDPSIAPPHAMLAGDGEVSLFWETKGQLYFEVSFPGDGTCHYILTDTDTRLGVDDLDVRFCQRMEPMLSVLRQLPKPKEQ